MSRYLLTSDDLLIFRDGRPFGDFDVFGGTSLDWPLPQTLAGMCRTAVGFGRAPDYFKDPANAKAIEAVGLERLTPLLIVADKKEALMPMPADLICIRSDREDSINAVPLAYQSLREGEGTDIPWEDWYYATLDCSGKPCAPPRFLRRDFGSDYLNGRIPDRGAFLDPDRNCVSGPVKDLRIHTAIDPATGAVREQQLFAEAGIHLAALKEGPASTKQGPEDCASKILGAIGISFELTGLESGERLPREGYLGGERRRVTLVPGTSFRDFELPDFKGETFIKLILTTPGDFGNWVPSWLHSGKMNQPLEWVPAPGCGVHVRLRSAVVNGWEPVSGWDYRRKREGPKAFRKLVRPGSVYLLETKEPDGARILAHAMQGASICDDPQSARNGYGQVIPAKATIHH